MNIFKNVVLYQCRGKLPITAYFSLYVGLIRLATADFRVIGRLFCCTISLTGGKFIEFNCMGIA